MTHSRGASLLLFVLCGCGESGRPVQEAGTVEKPVVLFLCTGNSARSQMAEAILRHEAGDRFEVLSAGTHPKGMNPLTVRVMEELGRDLSAQRSKSLDEYLGKRPIDTLITVCGEADKECAGIVPGVRQRLHWPFEDPAAVVGTEEERLQKFRQVRDQIQERVERWLKERGT